MIIIWWCACSPKPPNMCAEPVLSSKNRIWGGAERHRVIPTGRITWKSSSVIHPLIFKHVLTPPTTKELSEESGDQMQCFLPDMLVSTSKFMKLFELLSVSTLCSFISLSHFIWLGPISPSLARLLLLLNKSSWDMSRRKIFIGKFHLHSTPHLFRLSSQAPKEKELRK